MESKRACCSCELSKSLSEFSKNQLAKGHLGRCKACAQSSMNVMTPGRSQDDAVSHDAAPGPKRVNMCAVCGIKVNVANLVAHESSKNHLLNLELSLTPGYISIHATGLPEKNLRATGLVKKDAVWVSSEAVSALRSISQTGLSVARFNALKGSCDRYNCASPQDLVSDAVEHFAASLVEVKLTGVANFHFRRASDLQIKGEITKQSKAEEGGKFGKWCSPSQLAAAKTHRKQCTIEISTTGLERSRFCHIGLPGDTCSGADLKEATALIDARKSGIPLRFFDDGMYAGREHTDSEEDAHVDRQRKAPIWVSPCQETAASNIYDGCSILHYIDHEHLYDF